MKTNEMEQKTISRLENKNEQIKNESKGVFRDG
jgi:hypothetical protein